MTAIRFSETRNFPGATMPPSMACGATTSSSIAGFCEDSDVVAPVCAVAVLKGAFAVFLQPHRSSVRSATSKRATMLRRKNITSILSLTPLFLQRRGGRQFKVEQRHLVIKKRLVITCQGFAPGADGIQ